MTVTPSARRSGALVLLLACLVLQASGQGCPFGFTSGSLPVGPIGGEAATGAGKLLRSNSGAPEQKATTSLTAGRSGPVLLQDVSLIEKLANFVRERIPERVVHARGASAKGFFEVTRDISDLTFADVLTGVGKKTPLRVRFSTVIGGQNSPEVNRDPRGFAVKFYTRQGNWDLVGNNFPVFFIRDAIRFPDMVHSLKPNPQTGLPEAWRWLDFLAREESLNMLSFLQDDVGIPLNYRSMNGAGVHTYSLINKAGNVTWVKFHWITQQGVKNIATDAEAAKILAGGAGNSHATKDLIDAIAAGNFPSWKLFIQTMQPADGARLPFDPLDPTKTWPEALFPMREVGRMVLNENNGNFFAENEMLAFAPSSIVPGIGFSPDKLLQGRIFAYADAQRYRLGGNYLMLPANAPAAVAGGQETGYLFDGAMNFKPRASPINYFPSSYEEGWTESAGFPTADAVLPVWDASAAPVRQNITRVNWDTKQPGDRYRSWDAARQSRFVDRWVGWLVDPVATPALRQRWVELWGKADAQLGAELSTRLNKALATSR